MIQPVSAIPGRIRWQHQVFKGVSELPFEEIKKLPGVRNITVNAICGSVTIFYNAENNAEKVMQISQMLKTVIRKLNTAKYLKTYNIFAKTGALTSFGVSVIALGLKAYKVHAIAGVIGLSLLSSHVFYHKKRILT